MSERVTIDSISLKSQFERFCSVYQDMKNQVDLVEQELNGWDDQHEELKKTGDPEEILKHFDVYNEIKKRYDRAREYCDTYANMLADFAFENKDLFAAALELESKKKELSIKVNHTRRGR